jgi:phosphatidylglycerophosphate synthase
VTQTIRRRPIRARNTALARTLAQCLARLGVAPNAVSVSSLVFAALGGAALVLAGRTDHSFAIPFYLGAAALIELRLLANLLDGMIAVEGGKRSPTGELFNEVPDRFADSILLISAGYAIASTIGATIGWLAALLAVLTAYVRALAMSQGLGADFSGPMAKPQRMHTLALACIGAAIAWPFGQDQNVVLGVLALITAGTALTVVRRLARAYRALRRG